MFCSYVRTSYRRLNDRLLRRIQLVHHQLCLNIATCIFVLIERLIISKRNSCHIRFVVRAKWIFFLNAKKIYQISAAIAEREVHQKQILAKIAQISRFFESSFIVDHPLLEIVYSVEAFIEIK